MIIYEDIRPVLNHQHKKQQKSDKCAYIAQIQNLFNKTYKNTIAGLHKFLIYTNNQYPW